MAESILPIIIRGSETAKVDCPERVGAARMTVTRKTMFGQLKSTKSKPLEDPL
jgi:hypothetical protein